MKKLVVSIMALLLCTSLFAQVKSFADYREKKMSFYLEDDYSKVVKNIENELSLVRANKNNYSTEEFLTYETSLIVDSLFFNLVDNELPKNLEKKYEDLFLSQEEKCEDYMGKRKLNEFSSNFLLALADLKCQMPYVISIPKSIPKLQKAKDILEAACEKDPKNCAALMSKALWFEYSPGIAGGSHKKALAMMEEASRLAKTNVDKFFNLMFKAQILNSLKRTDECYEAMRQAHSLYPEETFSNYLIKQLELDIVL